MNHLARSILMMLLAAVLTTAIGCGAAGASYKYANESAPAYAPQADSNRGASLDEAESDDGWSFGGEYWQDEAGGGGDKKVEAPPPEQTGPKDPGPGEAPEQPIQPPKARMIIYNAQIGLLVFKVEDILKKATAVSKANGGWIQQSTSTSLTIRIPAEKFEMTVAALEGLGDITYKNVVGTDVTEEFFDLQIRLKNAMALRDRYIELLAQAKTVEASLAIEKELARLTESIELMKGRIRFLRDNAAFSTITLTIEQKNPTASAGRIALPFGWLGQYSIDSIIR